MRNTFSEHISRGSGHVLIGTYLASYVMLQYSGVFGPVPAALMHVLHQWPALTGVAAFVLHGLAWGAARWSGHELSGGLRKRVTLSGLAYLGLLLVGAGILLSSVTRFEGSMALSEGQEASLTLEAYEAGTLYQRKFSKVPSGTLLVQEVEPFPPDKSSSRGVHGATVLYRAAGGGEPRAFRIHSLLPARQDGFTFTTGSAGFAPHVFLFDRSGTRIDDFYAVMQLQPAGAEDAFRFDGIIPHTFFLRYYPNASLVPDAAGAARAKSGPVFRVRIARNLDVVANQYAAPDETVFFDKLILSVGDVRKWIEVQVVRDPGMYLVWPGMLLTLCSAAVIAVRRFAGKAGK